MPTHTTVPDKAAMVSDGPNDFYKVTSSAFPSTAFAAGASSTVLLPTYGYSALTASASLTDNVTGVPVSGLLSIQRYADVAGAIPQGSPVSIALGAVPGNVLNLLSDGNAFQAAGITITNKSGAATLSQFELLMHSVDAPASVTLNTQGAAAQLIAAMPAKDQSSGGAFIKDAYQTADQFSIGEALNLILIELRLLTQKFNEAYQLDDVSDDQRRYDPKLIT